jgi:hypothetical protein
MTRETILLALDRLHPGGYEGLDPAQPTPTTYAEYVAALLPGETAHSEADMLAAAAEQAEIEVATQNATAAIASLAAGLLAIFVSMTPAQRGRTCPARAGLKMVLEEGDIEAARAVIESIDALDEGEQAIKDSMLALFPA